MLGEGHVLDLDLELVVVVVDGEAGGPADAGVFHAGARE